MTHDERVYHHLYVESKSPMENAECIASLEELVEGLQSENAKLRSEPMDSFDRELWSIFNESDWVAASEYRKLKAENAKLRSQCADLVDERERLFQANVEKNGEVLRLVGENAKLREERREYQATIDSLVDECADYKAENAKLREQIHWLKRGDVLHVLTDQELADQQKHEREMQASITALDAENAKLHSEFTKMDQWHSAELLAAMADNAKLRELVREIWKSCPVSEDDCAKCSHHMAEYDDEWCDIPILMEQLGVLEVDG